MMALSQRITLLSLPFCLSHTVLFLLSPRILTFDNGRCLCYEFELVLNKGLGPKKRWSYMHKSVCECWMWLSELSSSFANWYSSSAAISVSRAVREQKYSSYRLIMQFSLIYWPRLSNLSHQKEVISYWPGQKRESPMGIWSHDIACSALSIACHYVIVEMIKCVFKCLVLWT